MGEFVNGVSPSAANSTLSPCAWGRRALAHAAVSWHLLASRACSQPEEAQPAAEEEEEGGGGKVSGTPSTEGGHHVPLDGLVAGAWLMVEPAAGNAVELEALAMHCQQLVQLPGGMLPVTTYSSRNPLTDAMLWACKREPFARFQSVRMWNMLEHLNILTDWKRANGSLLQVQSIAQSIAGQVVLHGLQQQG